MLWETPGLDQRKFGAATLKPALILRAPVLFAFYA